MHGDRIIGGMSAYADRKLSSKKRTVFGSKPLKPGVFVIPARLQKWAKIEDVSTLVMVNPHVKTPSTCAAKDWGWNNWVLLMELLPPDSILQCDYGLRQLPGVRSIHTDTFEHAGALLQRCKGIITIEGGMHHAAAALGKPAVVIFGGTNPPEIMGYKMHTNLAVNDPEALGWRCEHPAARAAMNKITPLMVYEAAKKTFKW